MSIEGENRVSKQNIPEVRNEQEEVSQAETAVTEVTQVTPRNTEEIQSEISSTAAKIETERVALNEARAKLNLPPSDTSKAIDSLNAKHTELTAELGTTSERTESHQDKVFEKAEDDPVIQEVQRTIQERVGREYESYVKGQWGKIAQEGARSNTGGSSRDQIEWRATNRAWDSFLITNPQVAEKYRGSHAEIDKAFQRIALRQKAQEALRATYAAPKVASSEEVLVKVSEQMQESNDTSPSLAELQERKSALAERAIVDSDSFREAIASLEDDPDFSWVETDKIVGRPFGEQNPGGWSFEYRGREGRIVEIARELSGTEPETAVEHVFHPEKAEERIKLAVLEGPKGPMYSVQDGTHRVAGAMVARLRQIPCDVRRIKYPLERITTVEDDVRDWRKKIDLGLIQGDIEELQGNNGKKFYKLTVEKEVLPWIRTVSQRELIKISRMYEKLYPGSLEGLSIPRDALVDPIANNYFMAGRWKEWEQKFKQSPRDENGIIMYS